MSIGPVKRISGVETNKYVGYYKRRGYNDNLKQNFEEKEEKEIQEKEEKENNEFELKENVQHKVERTYQDNDIIYDEEILKSKNSKLYKQLNSHEVIAKHQKNEGLQFLKLMNAYNKTNRKKCEKAKNEQNEKEDIQTKKEEMKEFKKSCQQKSDLDFACERLNKALEEKKQEEIRKKRRGHVYREHDDR